MSAPFMQQLLLGLKWWMSLEWMSWLLMLKGIIKHTGVCAHVFLFLFFLRLKVRPFHNRLKITPQSRYCLRVFQSWVNDYFRMQTFSIVCLTAELHFNGFVLLLVLQSSEESTSSQVSHSDFSFSCITPKEKSYYSDVIDLLTTCLTLFVCVCRVQSQNPQNPHQRTRWVVQRLYPHRFKA